MSKYAMRGLELAIFLESIGGIGDSSSLGMTDVMASIMAKSIA